MKRYIRSSISSDELKIRTEIWDTYGGWMTGSVTCEYNGELIGKIDIQLSDSESEIYIDMIEVKPEYRRQGVATAMFDYIKSEYSDYYVDWGFTTSDGTKLKEALTTTVKNPEYENLEKSIETLNKLLEKYEIKLNDDEWLENTSQDEKLKVADKWDMIYSKKRDLEYDMDGLREYITTWK